jgi:hypothetical protein
VQERDEYLETFISAFGLTLNDKGEWENGEFIDGYNALVNRFNELIDRYNKLVRDFNQYAVPPKPVGRPTFGSIPPSTTWSKASSCSMRRIGSLSATAGSSIRERGGRA